MRRRRSRSGVLVVGAGPAGLKAAEIAPRRGHEVRIVDAAERPGGVLRATEYTAASPLASSIDHPVSELAEFGVKPEVGIRVDEALLREIAPDHVVLATGSKLPPPSAVPGGETGHVVSGHAALTGRGRGGPDVLVYDTVVANEGPLVAEA